MIKVEAPGVGDPMRQWGRTDGKSLWWPVVGRNKRSVTLNLREEEGQELVRELVAKADIVVENFRAGTFEKWGLAYERLREVNPGIIMVRVTGYGQTGPYATAPATARSARRWAACATSSATPTASRRAPASRSATPWPPCTPPSARSSALQHRERTGQGQVVDAAIYEAVLAMME